MPAQRLLKASSKTAQRQPSDGSTSAQRRLNDSPATAQRRLNTAQFATPSKCSPSNCRLDAAPRWLR
eukprot:365027-Chlamydomonas_euryale.AAC.4